MENNFQYCPNRQVYLPVNRTSSIHPREYRVKYCPPNFQYHPSLEDNKEINHIIHKFTDIVQRVKIMIFYDNMGSKLLARRLLAISLCSTFSFTSILLFTKYTAVTFELTLLQNLLQLYDSAVVRQ